MNLTGTANSRRPLLLLFVITLLSTPLWADESPAFIDGTEAAGLPGGGSAACWYDLNNDGLPELIAGGTIWKNDGDGTFTQWAAGFGNVVAADFDNDSDGDLFSWSDQKLFRNDDSTFVPVQLPELPRTACQSACWADLNNDGFVDLYVVGYEDWDAGLTFPDLILTNRDGKSFELTFQEASFRARGVTAADYDQDGDQDLYVSNYRLQPNVLWINDGNGRLANEAAARNALAGGNGFQGGHSIGAAWGDFDADGLLDLFAGNFAHRDSRGDQPQSRFLRNLGPDKSHHFEDRGTGGVFYQESYASPAAADYDNDGHLDLFFTTVYGTASFGRPNNAVLFRGNGNFEFTDVTQQQGIPQLPPTYQAAWADFDGDGDVDLMSAGRLFINQTAQHRTSAGWIGIRLHCNDSTARISRDAIGASVRITVGEQTFTRTIEAGTGQGNQNGNGLLFGLGNAPDSVDVQILWPGGIRQQVTNTATGRWHDIAFIPQP